MGCGALGAFRQNPQRGLELFQRHGAGLESNAKPLAQSRHAADVDFKFVSRGELLEFFYVRPDVAETTEKIFETGRRNDLDDFARRIPRVPERMPLLPRLEHPRSRTSGHDVVSQQAAHRAGQHIRIFILAIMAVQGSGQYSRRHGMMHDGKTFTRLAAVDLPMKPEAVSIK